MNLCVRAIDFDSFYDFTIAYWNYSDSVDYLTIEFPLSLAILIQLHIIIKCYQSFFYDKPCSVYASVVFYART
jgi:hypothetical protein